MDQSVAGAYGIRRRSLNSTTIWKANLHPAYIAAYYPFKLEYVYYGSLSVSYANGIDKSGNCFDVT